MNATNEINRCYFHQGINTKFSLKKKIDTVTLNVAILSNGGGYTTPMAIEKIKKLSNGDAKTINYTNFSDYLALAEEVKNCLNYIKENRLDLIYGSRAEAYLDLVKSKKVEAPLALKIIQDIQEQVKEFDAIFIPGGGDISEIWYCDSIKTATLKACQYRTLVELTLINEARTKGIPLMGVCRGFQIINIFYGKKLVNYPEQKCIQNFKLIDQEKKGLLADLFREGVTGQLMHHLGIKAEEGTNGKGDLESLSQANGLIEAVELKFPSAAPVIGTQFHPELYDENYDDMGLSPNNETFFTIFQQSIISRKHKLEITSKKLVEIKQQLKPVV